MDFVANDIAPAAVWRIRNPLCVFFPWQLSVLGGTGSIYAKAHRDSHVVSDVRDSPNHLDGRASTSPSLRSAYVSWVFHRRMAGKRPDDHHHSPEKSLAPG